MATVTHPLCSLFAHLANILGPRDFTAPLCMLLLEKSANRITRQTPEEIQMLLSLPISLFQHNSSELQIYVRRLVLIRHQYVLTDRHLVCDRDIE